MDKNVSFNGQNIYTQGYSDSTVSTHLLRTAESDAAFLLPHIRDTDRILDVGCGPGSITVDLARYASKGQTIGIDISHDVLQKARALTTKPDGPSDDPGSVHFKEMDALEGLDFPDDSFDVVFSSNLLGHLPPPDKPLRALREMRRVLKPGGLLATRGGIEQHFYPRALDLDRLWGDNQLRVLHQGALEKEPTGSILPALFRKAGFDAEHGRVRVGAGAVAYSTPEAREGMAKRVHGRMEEGDPFRQSWLEAGIKEEEIQELLSAAEKWAKTEDAWVVMVHSEILAWK